MALFAIYCLVTTISIPCFTVVTEVSLKASILAMGCIFGCDLELKIESAEYLASLLS